VPTRSNRCELCGARLTSNQISIWEKVAAIVCGSVLLAVLMVAGYGTYQWLVHQEHRLLDDPVWHEPFTYLSL
jgi:hypothetical protein